VSHSKLGEKNRPSKSIGEGGGVGGCNESYRKCCVGRRTHSAK
jgi:hypothetical protein